VLAAAAAHRGTSLGKIYQHCPIFTDGAVDAITSPATQADALLRDARRALFSMWDGLQSALDG